jgi:hypothetical protein
MILQTTLKISLHLNDIYVHSGNSPSLDRIHTGTQLTSTHQAMGLAVNVLNNFKFDLRGCINSIV